MGDWRGQIQMRALAPVLIGAIAVICAGVAHGVEPNLITNGDFESPALVVSDITKGPADWQPFVSSNRRVMIGVQAKIARGGKQSLRFIAEGSPESYQGVFQAIPVDAGATYRFRVFVRSDPVKPMQGAMRGQVSIEWKDGAGGEVDRTWGGDWGASTPTSEWTEVSVSAAAPARATKAHFVITQFDGKDDMAKGAFVVDDATVILER